MAKIFQDKYRWLKGQIVAANEILQRKDERKYGDVRLQGRQNCKNFDYSIHNRESEFTNATFLFLESACSKLFYSFSHLKYLLNAYYRPGIELMARDN